MADQTFQAPGLEQMQEPSGLDATRRRMMESVITSGEVAVDPVLLREFDQASAEVVEVRIPAAEDAESVLAEQDHRGHLWPVGDESLVMKPVTKIERSIASLMGVETPQQQADRRRNDEQFQADFFGSQK